MPDWHIVSTVFSVLLAGLTFAFVFGTVRQQQSDHERRLLSLEGVPQTDHERRILLLEGILAAQTKTLDEIRETLARWDERWKLSAVPQTFSSASKKS